jgi:hypothetical protein
MNQAVEGLIREGVLERVSEDAAGARALLEQAGLHLESAARILDADANGAYSLLYDGVRKAVTAHLMAAGLRVKADRPGSHRTVVQYAQVVVVGVDDHLRHFDRMRRRRNRSEYGVGVFGAAEVTTDLEHARAIVVAVQNMLGDEPGPPEAPGLGQVANAEEGSPNAPGGGAG